MDLSTLLYPRADSSDIQVLYPIDPITPSHKRAVLAVCAVCLIVAWFTVLMRFYTRAFIVRSFGGDDYFIGITSVCFKIM
jgi:hypothetical protein